MTTRVYPDDGLLPEHVQQAHVLAELYRRVTAMERTVGRLTKPQPLHLLTDDTEREIAAAVRDGTLGEQLLGSLVITLLRDVKDLKKQVKELQLCQPV